MKRFTITLLASVAMLFAAFVANAQSEATIKFRTLVEPKGQINLIFTPTSGVTVEGAKEVTITGGKKAWEVEKQWITIKGPVTYFDCNMSGIDSIELKGCTSLKKLYVNTNKLRVLDLEGMSALEDLDASATDMRKINLKGCTALKKLTCDGARLNDINLHEATNLESVSLTINQLRSVDLTGLTKLKAIALSQNGLTSIKVENLPALETIGLSSNPITTCSFANCDALREITLKNGALSSFSASGLKNLGELSLYHNKITSIELKDLPKLGTLDLSKNKLSKLDFSKLPSSISHLELAENKFSGDLKISNLQSLREFGISKNMITSFTIEGCESLEVLNIAKNALTSLDLSQCESDEFTEVYASENKLTSVKLNEENTNVYLSDNAIETIDPSVCKDLEVLDLGNNNLTSLDVSKNEKLRELYVHLNKIGKENMEKLFNGLADRSKKDVTGNTMPQGTIYAVMSRNAKEENLCTSDFVKSAKKKNWSARDKRTNQNYDGAFLRTITSKVEGKGGKITLNGGKTKLQAYTDTRVNVEIQPEEGFGLAEMTYAKNDEFNKDIFWDQSFWVDRDGEVTAKFTDKIAKVVLHREGYGILQVKGSKADLNKLPIGKKIQIIAEISPKETEYDRELSTLKIKIKSADGKTKTSNIKGEKEFTLEADTRVEAVFTWLRDDNDPHEGDWWVSDTATPTIEKDNSAVALYPNPARENIFVENGAAQEVINLFTLEGVRVLSAMTDAEGRAMIDLSNIADGAYIVMVGNVSKRLIVRH